jgi:acetate kinase
MSVLVINAGSSSVRLALFGVDGTRVTPLARHRTRDPRQLEPFLDENGGAPQVIAHRVVHGGSHLLASCAVDAHVEAEIARLGRLAPLHNPIAAEWMGACRLALPRVLEVAVFDTSFFSSLPVEATTYALPRALIRKLGLRRFGFHGIAHQALWQAWRRARPELADGGRLVSFQLGSSCSVAAIRAGRPVDTSTGFTPLEGLVMATRAGDLDPGLVLHLLGEGGLTARELGRVLDEESGLQGLAGESDVGVLCRSRSPEAQFAVDLYARRARKYLGAYLALLGGADGVAFGGGVGEHVPEVRARILGGLGWCGLHLDERANRRATGEAPARISRDDARLEAWVLPVDEETVIAEEALAIWRGRS